MTDYIQPELMVLIPVLYLIGFALKKSTIFKDKYIPLVLGVVGIILSFLYFMFGDIECNGTSVFTAITQGILCAGASTYANQIYKQLANNDD